MSQNVRITDVSPRDGLQNEPGTVPTTAKIELVRLLSLARVDEIEVSSFVSAKWIPQLGDATEVITHAAAFKSEGMLLSALVPNEKGLDGALDVNDRAQRRVIDKVSVFTAASETFSKRNTNASIAETLERFRGLIPRAHAAGLLVRGYVSCVIACPFEGQLAPERTIEVARKLIDLGVDELDYGDTIGAGTPDSIAALLECHRNAFGTEHLCNPTKLTLHLHDTFGRAQECVTRALQLGVRSFDGAAGGLGGCPYASTPSKRAPGNIDTSAIVNAATGAGLSSGVRTAELEVAATFARSLRNGGFP